MTRKSDYSGDTNAKLVLILVVKSCSDDKWPGFGMRLNTKQPDHLKTGHQKVCYESIQYSNVRYSDPLGIQMNLASGITNFFCKSDSQGSSA